VGRPIRGSDGLPAGVSAARRAAAARRGPLDALLTEALAPLGRALADCHGGRAHGALLVHVAGFPTERLPVSYFFRPPSQMGPIDLEALALARGRVLDVGACAGAHAVPLASRGLAVTALEILPEAVAVLRARGVRDARERSVWAYRPRRAYDTILALMNGIGLAGTGAGLGPLLSRLRGLVAPGGQLLIDSTRLDAEGGGAGGEALGDEGDGTAELHYQLEYRGRRGPPFPQLFLDEGTLARAAAACAWSAEVVAREGDRYLARLHAHPTPAGRRRAAPP
jgi:hypothetical protein